MLRLIQFDVGFRGVTVDECGKRFANAHNGRDIAHFEQPVCVVVGNNVKPPAARVHSVYQVGRFRALTAVDHGDLHIRVVVHLVSVSRNKTECEGCQNHKYDQSERVREALYMQPEQHQQTFHASRLLRGPVITKNSASTGTA